MKVDKSKWETKVFGNICSVINGKSQKDVEDPHGRFPIYGSGGIMGYAKDYICEANTTIIGRKGTINAPILVKEPFWNIDTAFGLHPLNEELSPYYLYYFCVAFNFTSIQSGVTIPSLTKKDISKILVPVPPLSEQQAIASELDAIQSLITKYKEQLNDYDNLAKSIFNEMFGDVISNDKGWERKKLSYMCSEVTSSKRIFAKEYVKEGIPFYRSKEVIERSKGLKPSIELFISTERYNEIKKQYGIPQKNDLLISAVGTIGEIWVVNIDEPFYFKDGNLIWVKSDGVNNSIYLKYLLRILIAEYKKSMPNGAAYAALTINKLQNMTVYAIPLPLQQAFAARITAIESQKDKIKQQIADLQTLFDSRMQYYFD